MTSIRFTDVVNPNKLENEMKKVTIDQPGYCQSLKDMGFRFEYSSDQRIVEAKVEVDCPLGKETHGLGVVAISQDINESNAKDIGEFITKSLNQSPGELAEIEKKIDDLNSIWLMFQNNSSLRSKNLESLGISITTIIKNTNNGTYRHCSAVEMFRELIQCLESLDKKLESQKTEEAFA